MNTTIDKKSYLSPQIERVTLDNEISLILVSGDPGDPTSDNLKVPEYFNNNPFIQNQG
jgi:hypothetical protein